MKLWVYVVRRLILLIPTLIGLTFIVFGLLHAGGTTEFIKDYLNPRLTGPARQAAINDLIVRFHLNEPLFVQYFYWIRAVLGGDLGYTAVQGGVPVSTALTWFLPNTLVLTVFASALTWILAIPIGVFSAVRRDSVIDQGVRVATFTLYSMPIFLIGYGLLVLFGVTWRVLPIEGMLNEQLYTDLPSSWFDHSFAVSSPTHILMFDAFIHGYWGVAWDAFLHVVAPTLTLTLALLAGIVRILRASMLEVLDQDYIRLARAKGAPERVVNNLHARRNALLPTVTTFGYLVASLLGGAVVVEDIFTFKGIGWWTTQALLMTDVGGIMGTTLIFGLVLVLANLAVDILYGLLDPRIRY